MSDIYNYISYNIEYVFDMLYLDHFTYNLADKYYIQYLNNKEFNIDEVIEIYNYRVHKLSRYQNLIDENRNKLLFLLSKIKNNN